MPVADPWLTAGSPAPVQRQMIQIKVYKWVAPGATSEGYTELTNVRCLQVSKRLGPEPPRALFRYVFGPADAQAPQSLGQAISTNNTLPKTVQIGDRLLVQATPPGGAPEWIFDGYPLTWRAELREGVEMVVMEAAGAPKRLWDTPLPGALVRQTDQAETPGAGNDVATDIVAQFNPKGIPNATPADADSGSDPKKYPVFLDPLGSGQDVGQTAWTLNRAAAYLLYTGNDETYVYNPDRTTLDEVLVARVPVGSQPFDPANPGSYNTEPITVPDTPLKGRDVLSMTWDLIRDYGFGMYSQLSNDTGGNPKWQIELFPNQAGEVKQILLQPKGAQLDPALSNVGALDVGRELEDVANRWEVHGHLERYEASFVLAPGFPMAAADGASLSNIKAYDRSTTSFDTGPNNDAYRLYLFDETGEGHYATGSATALTTAASLEGILGAPDDAGKPQFVRRRRKPLAELLTKGTDGRQLRPALLISKDYAGAYPAPWDGTGTWQLVQGGYEVLRDRIGIRIHNDNPNKWKIGKSPNGSDPYPLGVVKGVEAQCQRTGDNFTLMLTCMIEGDRRVKGTADRRAGSPLAQTITRTIDASDRYYKDTIAGHSWYAPGAEPIVKRDDTAEAAAEAAAVRFATEMGQLAGTVTCPRFTAYYELGDRIDQLEGRTVSFQTNTTTSGDAPIYPVVVGITWDFQAGQRTTLALSDASSERANYRRALGGRHGTAR